MKVDGKKLAGEPMVLEKTVPAAEKRTMPELATKSYALFPKFREQPGLFAMIFGGVAATLATIFAIFTSRLMARRKVAPRDRFLFGKPARHYGYGRYHLGRVGTAWIAYTYKLPDVRYRLPEMSLKLPPIRVKLPEPKR
jgi:hypothetical protein